MGSLDTGARPALARRREPATFSRRIVHGMLPRVSFRRVIFTADRREIDRVRYTWWQRLAIGAADGLWSAVAGRKRTPRLEALVHAFEDGPPATQARGGSLARHRRAKERFLAAPAQPPISAECGLAPTSIADSLKRCLATSSSDPRAASTWRPHCLGVARKPVQREGSIARRRAAALNEPFGGVVFCARHQVSVPSNARAAFLKRGSIRCGGLIAYAAEWSVHLLPLRYGRSPHSPKAFVAYSDNTSCCPG